VTNNWQQPKSDATTILTTIGDGLTQIEAAHPNQIPDLRNEREIVVGSDYTDNGKYRVISFVFTTNAGIAEFNERQRIFRAEHIPDNRRMSFKGLSDGVKRAALPYFFEAANAIPGICLTVAIHKSLLPINADFGRDAYPLWHTNSWESMLTIVQTVAYMVAGLSAPDQNLLWITDDDDIVANPQMHADLEKIFRGVSGKWIFHQMGTFECYPAGALSDASLWEDFISIPDLFAALAATTLTMQDAKGLVPSEENPPLLTVNELGDKGLSLLTYYSEDHPLKRLMCSIMPGAVKDSIETRWHEFEKVWVPVPRAGISDIEQG